MCVTGLAERPSSADPRYDEPEPACDQFDGFGPWPDQVVTMSGEPMLWVETDDPVEDEPTDVPDRRAVVGDDPDEAGSPLAAQLADDGDSDPADGGSSKAGMLPKIALSEGSFVVRCSTPGSAAALFVC